MDCDRVPSGSDAGAGAALVHVGRTPAGVGHGPGVPHTIGGISDALRGSRRAPFFAELLRAQQGQQLDGTLPTTTIDEVRRRRERSAADWLPHDRMFVSSLTKPGE